MRKNSLMIYGLITPAILLAALSMPCRLSAQCGSSASSCKSCHETQRQDPVNTKGIWHTQHAFGDFCEFCHAGNVKAKDKDAAHAGSILNPLGDVKGSCQSCHPNDFMQRAQKYAAALGVTISAPVFHTSGPGGATTSSATASTPCGPAAPTSGALIDLNKIYARGLNPTPPINIGNVVLSLLIVGTLALLGGLIWHYERPLPRIVAYVRQALEMPAAATPEEALSALPANISSRPEVGAALRALAASDAATIRAVTDLLTDREKGARILKALSHVDLAPLAALRESDQKALETLLALAKEMNVQGA